MLELHTAIQLGAECELTILMPPKEEELGQLQQNKNGSFRPFADDLRQEPVFVKTIINRYLILLPTDPRFLHTHREVMGNIVLHASSDSDVTRSKGHRY